MFSIVGHKINWKKKLAVQKCYICFKDGLLDVCPHHINFKIKKSKYLGDGVFVHETGSDKEKVIFKKNDIILEYKGEKLKSKEVESLYKDNYAPYLMYIGRNKYLDSACKRSLASMVNMGTKKENNCFFHGIKNSIYIKASKDIKNFEELLCDYGEYYENFDFKNTGIKHSTTRLKTKKEK